MCIERPLDPPFLTPPCSRAAGRAVLGATDSQRSQRSSSSLYEPEPETAKAPRRKKKKSLKTPSPSATTTTMTTSKLPDPSFRNVLSRTGIATEPVPKLTTKTPLMEAKPTAPSPRVDLKAKTKVQSPAYKVLKPAITLPPPLSPVVPPLPPLKPIQPMRREPKATKTPVPPSITKQAPKPAQTKPKSVPSKILAYIEVASSKKKYKEFGTTTPKVEPAFKGDGPGYISVRPEPEFKGDRPGYILLGSIMPTTKGERL